jgi:pimeloyl-ACP methyl ester carboxylesterase
MTGPSGVLLVHGGLWEDTGADWFWRRTGVVAGLERRGLRVLAPDRLRRAASWEAEAAHLAAAASSPEPAGGPESAGSPESGTGTGRTWTVVGGSFGCAAAARLVLDYPQVTARLLLAWPASAADEFTRVRLRAELSRQGAPGAVLDRLLGGGVLPGTADAELASLEVPAGVMPAVPPNPLHPRSAADALLRLLPSAVALPGGPEAPRPEFAGQREAFLDAVAAFATADG